MTPMTAKQLHDAISACDELCTYISDWEQEEFCLTRSLQLIAWKLIDIVADAIRRAETSQPSLRRQIPELDDIMRTMWQATDTCRCGDASLLWEVAVEDTPVLREKLAAVKQEALANAS